MAEYMNNTQNVNDVALDWDDVIENDGQEFIILPEGDYNFTITDFERSTFPGSKKMSACNKATLTLKVETEKGTAYVRTDLILNKMLEFKISAFFRCIGRKKTGERSKMDWSNLVGERGRAHFKPRKYTDKKTGEERQANDVERYIDYNPIYFEEDDSGDPADGDLPF